MLNPSKSCRILQNLSYFVDFVIFPVYQRCINSFTGKAYDASKVLVSSIPWGTIGKAVDFTVDASKAGEGNLEITISARGRNIPTQVHPQGSAKFVVSFVPLEGIDHIINITFNKELVTGAPFTAKIHTGKQIF